MCGDMLFLSTMYNFSYFFTYLNVSVLFCKQFDDLNFSRELKVSRAEKRAFSFDHRASPGSTWQIVAQTETAYECRIVTLCSTVQVCRSLIYITSFSLEGTDRCFEWQ